MRTLLTSLVIVLISSPVLGHETSCVSDPSDIRAVAQAFSSQTGAKFVLDPRVSPKVNTLGIDLDSIDLPVLTSIFNMHGYEVLESRGVLYVVPDPDAQAMRQRLDRIEGSETKKTSIRVSGS
jgi:type II secretory pathway component GspD/PulD (secretin)